MRERPRAAASCHAPTVAGKAQLAIKNKTPDTKDQLKWKWAKGATTGLAELGNPVSGDTGYTFCAYDQKAGTPQVVSTFVVPPGGTCGGKPCWKATSQGFTYADRTLAPDGVQRLKLRAGTAGKAQMMLQTKGANLGLATGALPLTQSPSVTAQLTNTARGCWSADSSAPARVNRSDTFMARGD